MTSGHTARDERAEKVAASRAAAQRVQARRRRSVIGGVVIVVLLVAVGVGTLVQSQRDGTSASATAPSGTSGTANQSIVVGRATAPVTVTAYEDFQCPLCKAFEDTTGATLKALIDEGTVRVDYRPIAILDRFSTTSYSTRSLVSAGCVVASSPGAYPTFHDLLFANQPAENSAGLSDARLAELAAQAGAAGASACITGKTYAGWAGRVTDQSSKDKVAGTPTVLVNGAMLTDTSPTGLTAAVQAAAQR